jgi:hypothetical protein
MQNKVTVKTASVWFCCVYEKIGGGNLTSYPKCIQQCLAVSSTKISLVQASNLRGQNNNKEESVCQKMCNYFKEQFIFLCFLILK